MVIEFRDNNHKIILSPSYLFFVLCSETSLIKFNSYFPLRNVSYVEWISNSFYVRG